MIRLGAWSIRFWSDCVGWSANSIARTTPTKYAVVRPGEYAKGFPAAVSPTATLRCRAPKGSAPSPRLRPTSCTEYAAGRTPRQIAHDLNHEAIAPPRGRRWNASTINGSGQRGTGILRNDLYAGRLVWNKVRMIKDPDTGNRVSRPNPPAEWQIVEVPDLAIVSKELFNAAQHRKAKNKGVPMIHQRSSKRLLSGLLRCAACGGGMSTKGADKTGRIRVRCSTASESGTCPDPQTFYVDAIEGAALSALRSEMKKPAVIAEYVRTYHDERQRLAAKYKRQRTANERRLGELDREINRYAVGIGKGHGDPDVLGGLMNKAVAERRRLQAEVAGEPPKIITLHPAVIAAYERKLERLQEAIAQDIGDGESEHAAAIRDLVQTVTVSRPKQRPDAIEIEITGRLNVLLGENAFPNNAFPNRAGRVVGSGGAIRTPDTQIRNWMAERSRLLRTRHAVISGQSRIQVPHRPDGSPPDWERRWSPTPEVLASSLHGSQKLRLLHSDVP